MNAKSKSPSLA